MMGRQSTDQRRLFYDFCLENHVPADHLLRRIDGLLDLGEVREKLKPHYSPMGRPSVDPELMMRMLIVGYCFGIRSERRQRKIPRDLNEQARDYARSLVGTEPYEKSRRERKKVEMLFAHLKRHLAEIEQTVDTVDKVLL